MKRATPKLLHFFASALFFPRCTSRVPILWVGRTFTSSGQKLNSLSPFSWGSSDKISALLRVNGVSEAIRHEIASGLSSLAMTIISKSLKNVKVC